MAGEGAEYGNRLPSLILGFLLVASPLYLGGNRPMALLVLQLAGIAGLIALFWRSPEARIPPPLPTALRWAIGLLVAMPMIQLVPIPAEWWAAVPGRAPYAEALQFAGQSAAREMRPLSLHPRATQYSALVILPCLAVFLLARSLQYPRVRTMVIVFVGVAVAQAILGVLQLGATSGSPLYAGNPYGGSAASGTYVNKNHFAALMAMALPSALVLWFMETMPHRHHHATASMRVRLSDRRLARQIALALPLVFLSVALLFSQSRGGIGSGLLVLALVSFLLVWRAATVPAKLAFTAIAAAAMALGAYIGFTPVLERFSPDNLSLGYDGRVQIAAASLKGALEFLPFGSGLGTYADAFQRYQEEGLSGFVDHAHNDYVEFFFELGVAAVAIAALFAYAYIRRWADIARHWNYRGLEHLQVAAGLGMLAMLVHGTIDFNFHIPANAIYFSFLAGVFFYVPRENGTL